MADIDIIKQLRGLYRYPTPNSHLHRPRKSITNGDVGGGLLSRSQSTTSELSRITQTGHDRDSTEGGHDRSSSRSPARRSSSTLTGGIGFSTMPVYDEETMAKLSDMMSSKPSESVRRSSTLTGNDIGGRKSSNNRTSKPFSQVSDDKTAVPSRSTSTMSDTSNSTSRRGHANHVSNGTPTEHNGRSSNPQIFALSFQTMPVYDMQTARKKTRPMSSSLNGKPPAKDDMLSSRKSSKGWNSNEKPVVITTSPANVKKDDPWDVAIEDIDGGTKWHERTSAGKIIFIAWTIFRIILLLGLLYLFICALDFLSTAFRLLGGQAAGEVLQNSELLSNPVCGLMIGVLVTVLVQSSSTSTSIVVSMASASIISVELAIPIIMGANIGTSVTNTIVSLGQAKEKNEFRRAFGGATVHDMFNWLSVLILLPLEAIFHPLYKLTLAIVEGAQIRQNDVKIEILKVITKPFTSWVIQIDKKQITKLAKNQTLTDVTLLKSCVVPVEEVATAAPNVTAVATTLATTTTVAKQVECKWHWFAYSGLSDTQAGIIMLVFALAMLCICLILIVKTLNSLLKGSIAIIIKKFVNADFPGYLGWLTGYLAIVIGAICTFIVQSSSIFTSALTPLVGIGVITLERMYPLTLGANIGTTATGIIAALPNEGEDLANALQVALSHFFFNIFGIIIWYPLPFMRVVPVTFARILGNTTAEYRWFAIFYLLLMFFTIPALAFGLSAAGDIYLYVIGSFILFPVLFIIIMNVLQRKLPKYLPAFLLDWEFLPWWMHSLEPLDYVFGCRLCRKRFSNDDEERMMSDKASKVSEEPPPYDNRAFVNEGMDTKL